MSDSDGDDGPDAETCQKLCEEFASITGTDEACAQFYLQDRQWSVERAVNAYFDVKGSAGLNVLHDGDEPTVVLNVNRQMADAMRKSMPSDDHPKKFKLITWNVDGLDARNLQLRTKAVCKIIKTEDADVVFLQEVIPETFSYFENHLPQYRCIAGDSVEYFTAILLKKATVLFDSHVVKPFPTSVMGRNLLIAKVRIGGCQTTLMNSHLESTAEYSAERINQLNTAFGICSDIDAKETVLFGGDLNLRDKELAKSGGVKKGMEDLWIKCGMRKECEYTWDAQRNTNTQLPGRFKPRCRFDRVFQRFSSPPSINPVHFGLIGIQKIKGYQCFPSDHWGIIVHFDIDKPKEAQRSE